MTIEFDSQDAFLGATDAGFVILHQEPAPGHGDAGAADAVATRLSARFARCFELVKAHLGEPTARADEWDVGIPTFASGNGYVLWDDSESFVSLFINWDNPEDPAFILLARASLAEFDPTPGSPDPWQSQWMEKGEW